MGTIRTLLAIAVVFAHSPWLEGFVFVGGPNAVLLFYMTSGFLMSFILVEGTSYKSTGTFYVSRWLRLYPLYFVVLCLTVVAYAMGKPEVFEIYTEIPTSAVIALILSNLLLFGQDWLMFAGVQDGRLGFATDQALTAGLFSPQAWSLSAELTFYVIAPFILRKRRLLIALFAASLLLRLILALDGIGRVEPWSTRFLPSTLCFFLAGALSHQMLFPVYKSYFGEHMQNAAKSATVVFLLVVLCYFLVPVPKIYRAPLLFSAFAFVLPLTFVFQSNNKWDERIGELSYPIYIGHFLALRIAFLILHKAGINDDFVHSIAGVLAAIAFAIVLNLTIGRKVEAFRHQYKSKSRRRALRPYLQSPIIVGSQGNSPMRHRLRR